MSFSQAHNLRCILAFLPVQLLHQICVFQLDYQRRTEDRQTNRHRRFRRLRAPR